MISPAPWPDSAPRFVVELTEWDQVGPAQDPRLKGCSLYGEPKLQQLVDTLHGKLDIREGREGLEIATTSFVGRLDIGPLRIAITPKLPAMPLARLLRYAYGLRDVAVIEQTFAPTARHGLHDLLIALLVGEVDELLHRGLMRRYVPLTERLESPRGHVLIEEIIRQGGIREARLPCRHFERRTDWHLNRVLRTGLEVATQLAEDRGLRRHAHQLSTMFVNVDRLDRLDAREIDRAERELTRLTDASRPALSIIQLLQRALGLAFDMTQQTSRMPGFLFDMNIFFQRLLSRFLRDNLTRARIADEARIHNLFAYSTGGNPKRRNTPTPRPDYALFKDGRLDGFLDAKYRDIWERGLPAEWLYQLSLYALASPSQVSVLLYASMAPNALDERLEIHQPLQWSSTSASVVVRPVPLHYLAELLNPDQTVRLTTKRRELADQLVVPRIRKSNLIAALGAASA